MHVLTGLDRRIVVTQLLHYPGYVSRDRIDPRTCPDHDSAHQSTKQNNARHLRDTPDLLHARDAFEARKTRLDERRLGSTNFSRVNFLFTRRTTISGTRESFQSIRKSIEALRITNSRIHQHHDAMMATAVAAVTKFTRTPVSYTLRLARLR